MNIKIAFNGMEHSDIMDQQARVRLQKILDMVKNEEMTPFFVELWLKAHSVHPHHEVDLHLKTPRFDLHAHDEGTDIYVLIDNVVDKIVAQLKKHNKLETDKVHKPETPKRAFAEDKYTLGDEPEPGAINEEED